MVGFMKKILAVLVATAAISASLATFAAPAVSSESSPFAVIEGECDGAVANSNPAAAAWAAAHYDCLAGLLFAVRPASTIYGEDLAPLVSPDYVTRAHLATMMATFLTNFFDCVVQPHPYLDISPVFQDSVGNDVGCMHRLEITTGTSPTTFSPSDAVTRRQVAAFMGRIAAILGTGCPASPDPIPFTDIDQSSYAYDHVRCLYALGITGGTSATTYSPDQVVSRDMVATLLGRTWLVNADFAFP